MIGRRLRKQHQPDEVQTISFAEAPRREIYDLAAVDQPCSSVPGCRLAELQSVLQNGFIRIIERRNPGKEVESQDVGGPVHPTAAHCIAPVGVAGSIETPGDSMLRKNPDVAAR